MPAGFRPTYCLPALLFLLGAPLLAGFAQTTETSRDPSRHVDLGIAVRVGTLGFGLESGSFRASRPTSASDGVRPHTRVVPWASSSIWGWDWGRRPLR